jgi:hypothetical protein
MSYIDIIIPFACGVLCVFQPGFMVKFEHPERQRKIAIIKKCGYALLGVACLYLFIKIAA